jgi:sugar phosphate permease
MIDRTLSRLGLVGGRLHYAWVVVAVAFAVGVVSAGVRATPAVLIVPLEGEYHWSRATISLALGLNLLLYGAIGPFAAALMERFGPRRIMTLALATTAAAVLLSTAMTQAWQLIALWGVVIGITTGAIGGYVSAFISGRWFYVRAGLVVGILTAANSAGQLVFLPNMAALVSSSGWRTMALVLTAVIVAFLPLPLLLMRDRPEDLGLVPFGASVDGATTPARVRAPLRAALDALRFAVGKRDFWLVASGYFICGATTNGLIGTHLIPLCVDHGLTEVAGAELLATTGVFALIGGTISGWLSDRIDNRFLLCAYYGFRGLSLLYVPYAFDFSFFGLPLFSVVYGLDWVASVPPTVRLLSNVVGRERIGIMVAWITVIHQIGSASAAYLAGLTRMSFGTYLEAFVVSGALLMVAALMVLLVGSGRESPHPEPVTA